MKQLKLRDLLLIFKAKSQTYAAFIFLLLSKCFLLFSCHLFSPFSSRAVGLSLRYIRAFEFFRATNRNASNVWNFHSQSTRSFAVIDTRIIGAVGGSISFCHNHANANRSRFA